RMRASFMNTASPRSPASESHWWSGTVSSVGIPYRSARVTRRSPVARRSAGTRTRPRLRSRKRSGSPSGCDTEDVLELGDGDAVLLGHRSEVVPGPETLQDVTQPGAPPNEDRLAKRPLRVGHHLGPFIGRKAHKTGVAVVRVVFDPAQVLLDDIGKDPLTPPDNDEIPGGGGVVLTGTGGIVEEHFRPVRVEGTGRQ